MTHNTSHAIKVQYKNWRGELAWRTIVPQEIYFGETEYHPHPQWLLKVWDKERDGLRIYALKDIVTWDFKDTHSTIT